MSLRQQASHTDQLLRQMRSEVDDLTTALEARDSQNQVLRSQLQQVDRQLEEMKQGAEESVWEREVGRRCDKRLSSLREYQQQQCYN